MKGAALLGDPFANRGTGFSAAERVRLGIDGLLPPRVETIEEQVRRALDHLRAKSGAIEK